MRFFRRLWEWLSGSAVTWILAVIAAPAITWGVLALVAPESTPLQWKLPTAVAIVGVAVALATTARRSVWHQARRIAVWVAFVVGGLAVLFLALTVDTPDRALIYGLFGAAFIGLAALWEFARQAADQRAITSAPEQPTGNPRPATVLARQLRMMTLLTYGEVVDFEHMERRGPKEPWLRWLLGEELTLDVVLKIAIGINLGELQNPDVRVDRFRRRVHVKLPPARLLVSFVDEKASRVIKYRLGLLARVDPDLHRRARESAVQRYLTEVVDPKRLFEAANAYAEEVISHWLRGQGFRDITVETQLPAPDEMVQDIHQLPPGGQGTP
jgi:hypothetical protein